MRSRLSVLLVFCSLIATAQDISIDPVIFTANGNHRSFGKSCVIIQDSTCLITVYDAINASGYVPCLDDVPNLAVSRSAHWVRFSVTNASDDPNLLLSIPYSEIDELDVYTTDGITTSFIAHTGLSRPKDQEQKNAVQGFVFALDIAPGRSKEVLLRLRGFKPIHLPLELTDAQSFTKSKDERKFLLGGYAGIMVVMALYNLFLFISIKDKSYFFYSMYITMICAAQLSFQGVGPVNLWSGNTWFASRFSMICALFAVVLGMEFARRFMNTKALAPIMHRIVPMFYFLVVLIQVIYLFGDPWIGYNLAQAICGVTAIYLLVMTIVAVWRGSRPARFFLIAWMFFLVGVVLFVLKDAGVLGFSALTHYSMTIGSGIEGVLLSFGLADKINILQKEKARSQQEALESAQDNESIIREMNVTLEEKVKERTEDLQNTFNDLKRTQSQLVSAEKMASLGQLTAGIAHEINNPINFITSNIPPLKRNLNDVLELYRKNKELLKNSDENAYQRLLDLEHQADIDVSIEELNEVIKSINEGAVRTAEIVRGLRNFSRLDEDDLKAADLNEGLSSTIALLNPKLRDHIQVSAELQILPRVDCYPGKLNQVFMNLITNAAQAVQQRFGNEDGGKINVSTYHLNGSAHVRITDNGAGMTEEIRQRIFEPFFTTKDVGEGTGLGLSITHSIIEQHNGSIKVESTLGKGTSFHVSIPVKIQMNNAKRA